MSPRAKPPRLIYRPADDEHAARYVILDRGRQFSLGCADKDSAAQALAEHIATRYRGVGTKNPEHIPVSDAIAVYARDVAPNHARPREVGTRLKRLMAFFGNRKLSEVTSLCRAYAKQSSTDAMARRDLEDLKAAISHHCSEGLHDRIISVILPPRRPSRERWLTRSEAARLLWALWRRPKCKHIARFVLFSLYTGRRASVVMGASFVREPGRPWVDLSAGFLWPPEGAKVTKKRNPPIQLSEKLLIHLRAWARHRRYVVGFGDRPMRQIVGLKAVAKEIGLGDKVTPHVLRHTAATWMVSSGVDLWEASRYLGMTPQTLDRVYGHHRPEHLSGARDMHLRHRQRIGNESRERK